MPRPLLPLALASLFATGVVRADCELLYAPPEIRARLLAFHHANELRREQEARHRHRDPEPTGQPAPRPGSTVTERETGTPPKRSARQG